MISDIERRAWYALFLSITKNMKPTESLKEMRLIKREVHDKNDGRH